MKTKKSLINILFFILICLSYGSNGQAEQPFLNPYACWSYIKHFEENKAFSALALFLESHPKIIEIKTTNDNNLKPNELNDLEGIAYIYDDLAEVYTSGLLDFQKALSYNNMALKAYDSTKESGLKNMPVSNYFNPRRMLYYYFFPLNKNPKSDKFRPMNKTGLERSFFKRDDMASFYQEEFLDAVREKDFEELKKRVDLRASSLKGKLGLTIQNIEVMQDRDSAYLLELREVIEKGQPYNSYYSNFFMAEYLWYLHKKGIEIDYGYMTELCRRALNFEKEMRLPTDKDSLNLLELWLGISYLKSGNKNEGLFYIRSFIASVDSMDESDEERIKNRRKIIGKAIEKDREIWETLNVAFGVLGVLGSWITSFQGMIAASNASFAQGSYYSVNQMVAAQNAARQAGQNITHQAMVNSTLITLSSQALSTITRFTEPNHETSPEMANALKLVTPLVLKLGRYLNKFEQVELFIELGKTYAMTGKIRAAIEYFKEALELIEIQRSTITTESYRISFSAIKEDIYGSLVELLISEKRYGEAFEYVERSRARAFLDTLGTKGIITLKNDKETATYFNEMIKKEELATLLDQTKWGGDQLRSIAVSSAQDKSNLNMDLASLVQVNTVTAKEALSLSEKDLSILSYFITDKNLYIFLFDKGHLLVKGISVDKTRLFNIISEFRKQVSNVRGNLKDIEENSTDLYRLLIGPVRNSMTAQRLLIIPHQWLYYIPFQALQTDGRYLIDDYAVSYAPSLSIYKLCINDSKIDKKSILILANPTIADASYRLNSLPYAEEEAYAIARNFDNPMLLMKDNATAKNLKEKARYFDIIHIASHALFDLENPMGSAILLAADNQNNGFFKAIDFLQVDLKATLVVLSACQTGLSKISKGDEIIGFVRALMYSGSKAIISTLWDVEDKSTAKFMEAFYKNYLLYPKDIAIQKASKEIMNTYKHPFYWSPFILTGNNN